VEGERVGDTVTGHSPVDIDPQKVIEFAQAIIRLPSVTGEEGALGHYLGHALEAFGLQVELEEVAPNRHNVLATLDGEQPELALLFHSHMDTVPYGAMPDPVSGEVKGDHIWGRGSVDQKGGLAASVMALATIAQSGAQLHSSLGLALVIDEESEHRGSMTLVEQGLQARQAVVTEPSNLRLVIGCKGTTPFRISVAGKAAHGARPWLGVNAVHHAMQVVTALEELEYPEQVISGYGPVRGSLNLGVIEGGRAYNIVPDECMLWFDRRTVPGETQDSVLDAVQSILDRLAEADPPVTGSLSVARPDWNWEPIRRRGLWPAVTPASAPIRDLAARHHKAIVGRPVEVYFTDGYNEMDFLINDLNIPTIQYGPGDSRLCHTDEESLSIPQLLDATRVYAGMALESAWA
jgi:acetylornithine deacetylase/succinyl-diaminopimelate desuccinylase family protein